VTIEADREAPEDSSSDDRPEERVLLATDGGAGAIAALGWLSFRGRLHTLDLRVADVLAPPSPTEGDGAERVAGDARVRLPTATGVDVSGELLLGDPVMRLAGASRRADLLVLASNRTKGEDRAALAAFAMRLAESAECPVVVVPKDWEPSAGSVVVGIVGDGSDTGAIAFAASEAEAMHRPLTLVHAWAVPPALEAADGEVDVPEIEGLHRSVLDAAADAAGSTRPNLSMVRVLEHGEPVAALRRASVGAVLTAVGTRGALPFEEPADASVGADLIDLPRCPVAVVRAK
jgi:nucleotide-binding universal stress UspA family protein